MKRYRNLDGHSGVTAYECGEDCIRIRFVNGDVYEYTNEVTGREHVANMQQLAHGGLGLSTYVTRVVHDAYARKL
ncbi:MAG: hypothetical protein ABI178_03445 [Rhodanobacter sp.]